MNTNYFPSTGANDEKRLAINNKIYNPVSQSFMLEHGVSQGMQVLEIGCGFGHTAIWLAKTVGPSGQVIALDYSPDTLLIAQANADKAGVDNIKFISLDVNNLNQLNNKFDFVYGRWVLEFCKAPFNILESLYNKLNPKGIFTYEALNFSDSGNLSAVAIPAIGMYHKLSTKNALLNASEPNLANNMLSYLKQLNYKDIHALYHQPLLITSEQKSIYRLGLISSGNSYIKNQILTQDELNNLIEQFQLIEQDDNIVTGFYSNLLIKGTK